MDDKQSQSSVLTLDVIKASQDPSAANHHFSLGQVLATIELGLTIGLQGVQSGGFSGLLNPTELAQIIAGFVSIWVKQPASGASGTPQTPANPALGLPPIAANQPK